MSEDVQNINEQEGAEVTGQMRDKSQPRADIESMEYSTQNERAQRTRFDSRNGSITTTSGDVKRSNSDLRKGIVKKEQENKIVAISKDKRAKLNKLKKAAI